MSTRAPHRIAKNGFSLIELLTVVAIIAILMSLAVPAITGTQQAMALNTAGAAVESELTMARENALTRRQPVEVRFYKCVKDGTNIYCALQSFALTANATWTPLSKIAWLADGLKITEDTQYTTLFTSAATNVASPPAMPAVGAYTAMAFQFLPNGYTTINSTTPPNPFFTIQPNRADNPPKNYFTIQIDPINGKIRSFRP